MLNILYKTTAIKEDQRKNIKVRKGLIAFILWEISLYSILILFVDFHSGYSFSGMSMMFGYLCGITILKFCQTIADQILIRFGYGLSVIFSVMFFVLYFLKLPMTFLLPFCCFFHTIGNAFLCPTIMSFLTKERSVHEQGKVFGLVIAADSIAYLFGIIFAYCYKLADLNVIYAILFSFLIFILSWFPYYKCEKHNKSLEE